MVGRIGVLTGVALLLGGLSVPKAHALAAAAEDAQVFGVETAEDIGDEADIAAACECKADIDKDGDVTLVDRNILDGCVFVDPTAPFCDNADVNCDGVLDPTDLDAWDCVFENPTLPPEECCGKTVEDVCIYTIQCIDGACTSCPVRNPGLICAGAACPGGTCSVSYSSTCGADCCVELVWTGECRPPAGEPPCPQENNPCTCDPTEGACCQPDGSCTNGPESKCTGQYMGDGSLCLGDEACCFGDGSCAVMDALCCEKQGGQPQGPGSVCEDPEPCCLPPNKECVLMEPNCCLKLGGSPNGCTLGTTCCISDTQCPSQKCRPGVCIAGECDLLPKQPGCCTTDTQCPDTKCRFGFCDTTTNSCGLTDKVPGCCETDDQCPDTKCREGFCDANNVCQLGPKAPGCCETDTQCSSTKCRSGFCDANNTCQLGPKDPDCCETDGQCDAFATKCRPGLCDPKTNTCFTGPKNAGCCETDGQCPDTKCRIGFCDTVLNECRLLPKNPPDCCETDAQCVDLGTKCRPGVCDLIDNRCTTGPKDPGCCESDQQCPKCERCDLATNTCFDDPNDACCVTDADCPGKCDICDTATNTCVKGIPNCCASDAQCANFATKCRPGLCDLINNTCFTGPKDPGCCESDSQCPSSKCRPGLCDFLTNTCFLGDKAPGCCETDTQCPNTKCRVGFCDANNTCQLGPKAPGCCETSSQCPNTKCRPGICDLATNTCTLGNKAPGCCETDAQCPSTKCRAGFCDANNTCQLGPKAAFCCETDAQCPPTKCRPGVCDLFTNTCTLGPKIPGCCTSDAQCPPGSVCDLVSNTCVDVQKVPKWSQRPGGDGEDVASNLGWPNFDPNVIIADDWTSDGRVITAVRWWGSNVKNPDPKACDPEGADCGPVVGECVCASRVDGSLNCADAISLANPTATCQDDSQCVLPSKCFGQPGALGVCAVNCGDTPPDPKVCPEKGLTCGDPGTNCICETRIDGTLNCADAADYFSVPPIHGFCINGDADCPTGTKCFTNRADGPVCAHNCGEHTDDPKLCSPLGSDCGVPGVDCFCSERIDGTQNCADINNLALCDFPCASDADCDVANGVKCFVDPAGINPGCCTRNCSGLAGRPVDKTVRDGRPGVDQQRQSPTDGVDSQPLPDGTLQPRTGATIDRPEEVTDPDGWFISMHQPVELCVGGTNAGSPCGGAADCPGGTCENTLDPVNQAPSLALYFCDVDAVQRFTTTLPSCDGHPVIEYQVWLDDCCLVQSNPDTRYDPPLDIAFKDGFHEQNCDQYFLSIQAVVGVKFFQDPTTLECIQQKTNRSTDADFWGWHTSFRVCGKGDSQAPKDAFQSTVKLGGVGKPLAGPWGPAATVCSPPNMAFELLTPDPVIPQGKEDLNGNCVPDACECPIADPPKPPAAASHAAQAKNRYLSIMPNNPGKLTALRVTLRASATHPNAVGSEWWVSAPQEVCENSGHGLAQPVALCGPAPGIPKRTMWWSQLSCNQACVDWQSFIDIAGNALDVLHIGGRDVATDSIYDIRAVDCVCDKADPGNYSAPTAVSTSLWGDTTHNPPAACPHVPPNGPPVDLIPDCTSILQKFSNDPCALIKSRSDLEPHATDLLINITDVLECANAFSGGTYPYVKPVGCP